MLINLTNSLTIQPGIQQTYFAQAGTAGATSIGVKNINGLNANWGLQVGQTGEETAEILINSSASGTVVNFGTSPSHPGGTLLFGHGQDSPIYQVHYDQVVFYRSTTGTAGPFGSLATVNIQPDSLTTQYNDTGGAAGYAYYAQYYNSVNGDLSGSSSIFTPGGPSFYSLQKLRSRTKEKLYSAGYIRDDSLIDDWINEWYELMTNAAIKVNEGYMLGTNAFSFGTSGYATITDPYYKQAVKIEITWDGITYLPSTEIPMRAFSESDFFSAYAPKHAWVGETSFEVLPHTEPGTARMTYAQRFTPLVNDSDEVTQTLKAYTTSCVEYCLSVAYGLDQKDSQQQEHFQKFVAMQNTFIAEITPRDEVSGKMIDMIESTSGLEDDVASDLGDYIL